ncbi:MAG: hypothetical protein JNL22_09310 [Bacteroidales bacterium]|nr:hypothetical protein [Bacteroidales bacterium]
MYSYSGNRQIPYLPNLLIIGGASRNVGKTSLILHLIEEYRHSFPVTCIKVTSVRQDEHRFHGNHPDLKGNDFSVKEETSVLGHKDTCRMLNAGADRVFYIETPDHLIGRAFSYFLQQAAPAGPMICESRHLRKVVRPGLFLLLRHFNPLQVKPGFDTYERLADRVVTIPEQHNGPAYLADCLQWNGMRWLLKHETA